MHDQCSAESGNRLADVSVMPHHRSYPQNARDDCFKILLDESLSRHDVEDVLQVATRSRVCVSRAHQHVLLVVNTLVPFFQVLDNLMKINKNTLLFAGT